MGTVWWHNGSTAGYKAVVMWFPKSDIYMSLIINRDPGYLLKPDLPIIRNLVAVLMPDAQWHLQHPKSNHVVRKKTTTKKKLSTTKSTLHKHRHHPKTTASTSTATSNQ